MPDFARLRDRMVEQQIARRGVRDPRVLEAMRSVPREEFVEPDWQDTAYDDRPLPIGAGQTISQPYIVALMVEAAAIQPSDQVLEVGAGCGYAAAVMGRLAAKVVAIERHESLGSEAAARLARLGFSNVELHVGDGSVGWNEAAPFDAIVVSAAGPRAPDALKMQLSIGGRLVVPVGAERHSQRLVRLVRKSEDAWDESDLGGVIFVPLVGAQGWSGDDGTR